MAPAGPAAARGRWGRANFELRARRGPRRAGRVCVWPAARAGGGGCVTLGAMFAASRDARPRGGQACRGAARPSRLGPPGSARRGRREGRGGGSCGRGSRWAPAGPWGSEPSRRGGGEQPSGAGARAGAAWRAGRGRGEPGGGGGATAAPPGAEFEKRMRFPPFFKTKNKTFFPISFAPPGLPDSRPQGRAPVGPGRPWPWRRRRPRASPAPPGGPGDPAQEAGPSVWAGGGSARQRPPQRHVGGRPSPSAARAGLQARPAGPRRGPASRGPLSPRLAGSRLVWRAPRAGPPPPRLLSGAAVPSPFLKGQRQAALRRPGLRGRRASAPARARGRRAGAAAA